VRIAERHSHGHDLFGAKIGIGIPIGIALMMFVFREIVGFIDSKRFTKVGCTSMSHTDRSQYIQRETEEHAEDFH